jgi:hypothetical protein
MLTELMIIMLKEISEKQLNKHHFGYEFELNLSYLESYGYIRQGAGGSFCFRRDLPNGTVTGYEITPKGRNYIDSFTIYIDSLTSIYP